MKTQRWSVLMMTLALVLATVNAQARWMSPNSGRFQTMDSYEGDTEKPASLHKYTYAENDPVNKVDPSGRNAYVVNGGGYTGHTAIAIDDPLGGVIVFHYFAASHTANSWLGDLKAVAYDKTRIWYENTPDLGTFLKKIEKQYGSVKIIDMAYGTVQDDQEAIDDMMGQKEDNDRFYSLIFGVDCHSWSGQRFRSYVGSGVQTPPQSLSGITAPLINGFRTQVPRRIFTTPGHSLQSIGAIGFMGIGQ